MEYVAFDFETANQNRASACALGAVKMKNGKEIDSFYTLINPEEEFGGFQIAMHGITPEDVKDAPTFVEAFKSFEEFVGNHPIISHTSFDKTVIRDANKKYNNRFEPLNYLDSFLLASSIWRKKEDFNKSFKKGLKPLAKALGYDFDHHNALADARACAVITEALIKHTQSSKMIELQQAAGYKHFGQIVYDETTGSPEIKNHGRKSSKLTPSEIKKLIEEVDKTQLDPLHPFNGKYICITGKVGEKTRSDWQRLIIEVGGIPQNKVGKKTNFLVEGVQTAKNIKDGISNSFREAKNLYESGQDISFLSGEEFIDIIM